MKKIFDMNGSVFSAMTTVYQILALNLFFIISGIWIVTTGAAVTALYSCCLKIAYHEPVDLYVDFKRAFKQNFKVSTIIWLAMLIVALILFLGTYYFQQVRFLIGLWIMFGTGTIAILAAEYLFPLIARYENTRTGYLRNAINLSFQHSAYSIIIFVVDVALLVFLPVFIPKLFLLWLATAFAATVLINSYIFKYVFDKYDESVKE